MKKKRTEKSGHHSAYVIGAIVVAALAIGLSTTGSDKTYDVGPTDPTAERPTASDSSAAPKIVAVQALHNFGKVYEGASVEHTFKVRNEGKAELTIEKAKGS